MTDGAMERRIQHSEDAQAKPALRHIMCLGSGARLARPLAAFLAGRGADYITGQIIPVDGGYSTTAVWPYVP